MPAAESAAVTADGPGIGTIAKPAAETARTSAAPGSLIAGVPASVISATRLPDESDSIMAAARLCSLCSCRETSRARTP